MDICRINELLTRVPQPPGEPLPSGVSDSVLHSFSERVGIELPEDLRQWLKLTNGPCVGPGGLFGIRPVRQFLDIESYLEMYPSWREKKWLPIAGDGCGNYYIVATQGEYGMGYPVLFIDTSTSSELPAFIAASDLEHFLVFLLEKELGNKAWPFDEQAVVQADPGIRCFVGIPLPWALE